MKDLEYFTNLIQTRVRQPRGFYKLVYGDNADTFAYKMVDTWDYETLYLLNEHPEEEKRLLLTAIREYNKEKWMCKGTLRNPKFLEMDRFVSDIKGLGFPVSVCRCRDYFSLDNELTGHMVLIWDVFSNFHPKLMTFSRQLKTLVAKES
jgi:hypothetical protein